jgi:hypothetical protein
MQARGAGMPEQLQFREEIGQYLEQELVHREGDYAQTLFGGSKHSVPVHVVLSKMLRVAVNGRHGGAFVIIPSDSCDSSSYDIKPKYLAQDLDLGLDMIMFWSACADAARKHLKNGYDDAIRGWTTRKAKMLLDAEAVGNLSCVDGCVILNRRLQLCGFGGEIQVSDEEAQGKPSKFTNYATGEEWEYKSFLKEIGGTRHRSAARLCKAHEGVLVFIVSQDGELKAFSSDADKVYAFGPLDLPFEGDGLPTGI